MMPINPESLAALVFDLKWESREAAHREKLFLHINLWRDILPEPLRRDLMGRLPGDRVGMSFGPGEAAPFYDKKKELNLKARQFDRTRARPRFGRFYPKGLLKDVAGVFPENIEPFRCLGADGKSLVADFNHPLAEKELRLDASVHEVLQKPHDRGGEASLLTERVTQGPGMQARTRGRPTDFLSGKAFEREEMRDDGEFYAKPRFVTHTDDKAIEEISNLYGEFLRPGMDVLDLMSGWRSHVPDSETLRSLVGLGLNPSEMADNPQLSRHLVHDVNQQPEMPFDERSFDLVICTVSVEYMIRPDEVFSEVARILRPGGCFVLTFSNRWFPPKVIRVWTELHEFERMGLVLEYFLGSGRYSNLGTFSCRGWPRPSDDKYYTDMRMADPVYAVWGQVRK